MKTRLSTKKIEKEQGKGMKETTKPQNFLYYLKRDKRKMGPLRQRRCWWIRTFSEYVCTLFKWIKKRLKYKNIVILAIVIGESLRAISELVVMVVQCRNTYTCTPTQTHSSLINVLTASGAGHEHPIGFSMDSSDQLLMVSDAKGERAGGSSGRTSHANVTDMQNCVRVCFPSSQQWTLLFYTTTVRWETTTRC